MKKLLPVLCAILILCGCKPGNVKKNADSEIVIALLDTGVYSSAVESRNLRSGYNYVTESDDTEDKLNHGTAVASVILGSESTEVKPHSPGAFLVPLVIVTKVDGKTVAASPDTLAKAIRDSVDIYGADIINVSLGIQSDNKALADAVKYAEKRVYWLLPPLETTARMESLTILHTIKLFLRSVPATKMATNRIFHKQVQMF